MSRRGSRNAERSRAPRAAQSARGGSRGAREPGAPRRSSRSAWQEVSHWMNQPAPIVRLSALRVLLPLCILGFMFSRIPHAAHWIGSAGFTVPDMGGDWRQPLYLPPLADWAAWGLVTLMVVSGLSLSAGLATPYAAGCFALTLAWVALADRLAAFTVSKLGTVLIFALWFSPCGARHSVDAWWRGRRQATQQSAKAALPTHVPRWVIGFFQATLVVMYCSSGICKLRNDWLTSSNLLWTHLHGSYQTGMTHFLMNLMPAWVWTPLQGVTLIFELLAPLWFGYAGTRRLALVWGLVMHAMIGLMFGPVIWFSLLMATLLLCCFGPIERLAGASARTLSGVARRAGG